MAKICPNCEKENPSAANYCMFCNTQLVEEECLSEEDKLRKKNAELQEQLELLKRNRELEQKVEVVKEVHPQETFVPETIITTIVEQEREKEETEPISQSFYQREDVYEKPKMFAHSFSFKGRIRRLEYGLSMIICGIGYAIFSEMRTNAAVIFFIPMIWFDLAQGAKRCHDRNNSGWYQIIPLYGLWMLFAEGDSGVNDYGVNPK